MMLGPPFPCGCFSSKRSDDLGGVDAAVWQTLILENVALLPLAEQRIIEEKGGMLYLTIHTRCLLACLLQMKDSY
jgi:hypothetical protein